MTDRKWITEVQKGIISGESFGSYHLCWILFDKEHIQRLHSHISHATCMYDNRLLFIVEWLWSKCKTVKNNNLTRSMLILNTWIIIQFGWKMRLAMHRDNPNILTDTSTAELSVSYQLGWPCPVGKPLAILKTCPGRQRHSGNSSDTCMVPLHTPQPTNKTNTHLHIHVDGNFHGADEKTIHPNLDHCH